MNERLSVGALVAWAFPGSGNVYHGFITEVWNGKGDEHYRIRGNQMDCYAFRRDVTVVS